MTTCRPSMPQVHFSVLVLIHKSWVIIPQSKKNSNRQSFPKTRHPTNLVRRDFLIWNNSNISVLHCHWGAECESLVALIGRLSRWSRPKRPISHPPRGLQPDSTGWSAFFLAVRRLQARLYTCFRGEPSATACRSAVFFFRVEGLGFKVQGLEFGI